MHSQAATSIAKEGHDAGIGRIRRDDVQVAETRRSGRPSAARAVFQGRLVL
jgi:hypothetical protein